MAFSRAELYDSATGALELTSAASRKHHGSVGDFDIDLPLTGTVGIEDRQGDGSTREMIVLTFSEAVTSVDSSATSCGRVESVTINGSEVIVNLVGVTCNGSDVTVTLTGVNGGSGSLAEASVTFGLLVGDVDGDGRVTTADVNLVRANIGRQPPTSDNFREDVTVNGKINHGDINVVRSKKGNRFGD